MANNWNSRTSYESVLVHSTLRDIILSKNDVDRAISDPNWLDFIVSNFPVDGKVYYADAEHAGDVVNITNEFGDHTFNFINPSDYFFILKTPQTAKFDYKYKVNDCIISDDLLNAMEATPNSIDVQSSPLFYGYNTASQYRKMGALAINKTDRTIKHIAPYIETTTYVASLNGEVDLGHRVVQSLFGLTFNTGSLVRTGSLVLTNPPHNFGGGYYCVDYMPVGYNSFPAFSRYNGYGVSGRFGAYSAVCGEWRTGNDSTIATLLGVDPRNFYLMFPNVILVNDYNEFQALLGKTNAELEEMVVNYDPNAPYTPGTGGGRPSSTGGGGGSFNSDPGPSQIIPPGTAGADAASTGMFNLYVPTLSELQNFGGWLWSENFNIDSFKRLFTDPVSSILSFSRAPFSLDAVMATAVSEIHFANLSSGISSARLTRSSGQVDWGSVNIVEYWGGAMDYAPYTKICLYLPWGTGFVDLKISDVMKGTITVKTNIDALSGDCVHLIIDGHGRVIGQHSGNVYQDIPFSGGGGFLRAVGSGLMSGAVAGIMTGGAGAIASVGLETARSVAGADYSPSRGGGTGAAGALMGVQYPYIIIDRPIQSIPASFGSNRGYPSNITSKLSMVTGYTEVKAVHLENIPATDAELSEIESLLKSGVIL